MLISPERLNAIGQLSWPTVIGNIVTGNGGAHHHYHLQTERQIRVGIFLLVSDGFKSRAQCTTSVPPGKSWPESTVKIVKSASFHVYSYNLLISLNRTYSPVAQQPPVGQDLIIEASRSHSDTPHSCGQVINQPDAENSTWQHTTLTTERYRMPPAVFEPTTSVSERPQTHALECAGIGTMWHIGTAQREYKLSNTTFAATCFDFCGKPSSGNVQNTHRNIIYT